MILSTSKDANPNYLAWVVQVSELKPHPNADRLQIATVHHCDVITGLDAKVGDIYVYFPIESVINTKFLSWSNSYEDKDLNEDLKTKGFFHKSSRVRAVKLRGEYSNGYIVPFRVVQDFVKQIYKKSLELPAINTSFDTICDELFVWKYVVPIKQTQENKPKSKGKIKKFNRVIPGQFEFHPDTKNLRHEIEELKPEDYIAISDKMHGCLEANTILATKEYGDVTIKKIVDEKLRVSVKSFDFKKQKIVWSEIQGFYNHGETNDWYEIELENGQKIQITGNHPVFIPSLNCYRQTKDLKEEDEVLFL